MDRSNSWIYIDFINNIWKFYRNANDDLCYKIMYEEGKWTKEKVIDKDVNELFVYVEDETIHILYITTSSNLKYCTMKEKQWMGRSIYQVDYDFYEIQNLKVEVIGSDMHIFFLMLDKSNNQVMLMQCIWNQVETKTDKLFDVVLDYNLLENYVIEVSKKGYLDLLFATYERDEFGFNFTNYRNNSWTTPKSLYSMKGEFIDFSLLVAQQVVHILHKYKENSMFCLEYVCIDKSGNVIVSKVHESKLELKEPIMVLYKKTVYAFWLEENNIFYSFFNGEEWNEPMLCQENIEEKIEKYHFYSEYSKSIKDKEVYGVGKIDLRLFFPYQFVMNLNESKISEGNMVAASEVSIARKKESTPNYKLELIRIRSENRELNKKLASINMQLQKFKRVIEEKEEYLAKVLSQKHNVEENSNIYLKLQKQVQSELEQTRQQLLVEQSLRVEVEGKWNLCEEKIVTLNQNIASLEQENEKLRLDKEQLMNEINAKMNRSFIERFRKNKNNDLKT